MGSILLLDVSWRRGLRGLLPGIVALCLGVAFAANCVGNEFAWMDALAGICSTLWGLDRIGLALGLISDEGPTGS